MGTKDIAVDVKISDRRLQAIFKRLHSDWLKTNLSNYLYSRRSNMMLRLYYGENLEKGYRREMHRQGMDKVIDRILPFTQ